MAEKYSGECPITSSWFGRTFLRHPQHCVNGSRTLAENIADQIGIEIVYRMYRDMRSGGVAPLLAYNRFSRFTADQLFFIGYAQAWCASPSEEQLVWLLHNDVHAPDKQRLNVVLGGMAQFAAAFGCEANSESGCDRFWVFK